MQLTPFKVLSEHSEYRDGNRFEVMKAELETPTGSKTTWSYLKTRDGVMVVALDKDNNLYVKREWRLNRKDFILELPSGWVETENPTDEDIIEAGNRELQEEVGVKANKLEKLMSFYPMNHTTGKFHILLATDLTESKLSQDEHEHLEVETIPLKEAYKKLAEDQIPNAQILIALLLVEKRYV